MCYGIISTVPHEQWKIYRQIILFQRIYYLSISLTGLPCHRELSIVLMSMADYKCYIVCKIPSSQWFLNTVHPQDALKLVSGACGWGTGLARSVSSVGEHQSDAYVSPSLPKRAETFGGFDNSIKDSQQQQQEKQQQHNTSSQQSSKRKRSYFIQFLLFYFVK